MRSNANVSQWIDDLAKLALPQRRRRAPWRALLLATPEGLEVYLPDAKNGPRRAGILRPDGSRDFGDPADLRRLLRHATAAEGLVLRLTRDAVIEKIISVPAEAEDVLAAIVENQLEMISPWPTDKALHGWEIEAGGRQPQLQVKVVVAAKSAVEQQLALAKRHGLAPSIVDYAEDAAATTEIDLLAGRNDQPVRGRRLVKFGLLALTIASIAIGATGVMQGLARQETLSWVSQRAAIAKRRAEAASKVTSEAARLEARYGLASDEKYRIQPAISIIEALTRTLPDGTWLEQLEVHKAGLRFIGLSQDAASLIGRLEASPFFSGVRFAAPVTPAAGGEKFTIEAIATEQLDYAALLSGRGSRAGDRGPQ